MGAAGYLYKPSTRKGPVIIVPNDGPAPIITTADGRTITAVRGSARGGVYRGHEGFQWVFPNDILGQQGASLSIGGNSITLNSTNSAYQGESLSSMKPRAKGSLGSSGIGGAGGNPYFGGGNVNTGNGTVPLPLGIDPSFVQAFTIPQTPYNKIDPIEFGKKFATYQREELARNLQQAQADALTYLGTEQEALNRYVPFAQNLQAQTVARENDLNRAQIQATNQFNPTQVEQANQSNQQELFNQYERAGVDVRGITNERLDRARKIYGGAVPFNDLDRAATITASSVATDGATARGFGDSSFARNLADKYTVDELLKLEDKKANGLDLALANSIKYLVDAPIKYNPILQSPSLNRTSQDIKGNPSFSPGQMAFNQNQQINANTLQDPKDAFVRSIQQEQFETELRFNENKFNSSVLTNANIQQLGIVQNNAMNAFAAQQNIANMVNGGFQQQLANQQYQMGQSQIGNFANSQGGNNTQGGSGQGNGNAIYQDNQSPNTSGGAYRQPQNSTTGSIRDWIEIMRGVGGLFGGNNSNNQESNNSNNSNNSSEEGGLF